jgi:hypothetical protein
MNEDLKNFPLGEISAAGRVREAGFEQLSTRMALEKMQDGRTASLKFAEGVRDWGQLDDYSA